MLVQPGGGNVAITSARVGRLFLIADKPGSLLHVENVRG
jgi:hypothetical protein